MADAGPRLTFPVSTHVLFAHGGAILTLVIAGALAAPALKHMKARRVED
jgi:hypothetical protein